MFYFLLLKLLALSFSFRLFSRKDLEEKERKCAEICYFSMFGSIFFFLSEDSLIKFPFLPKVRELGGKSKFKSNMGS